MKRKRKYIDELGVKFEDTPQGWHLNEDDYRIPLWEKQRQEWGFDERETWCLNYSFDLWLYERLRVYDKINIVDTHSPLHEFDFEGEKLNFQDCIDRMLEGLKISITTDEFDMTPEELKKSRDVVKIFALCFEALWW